MKADEYRKLCAKIHRIYGKPMGLSYWDSCSLADEAHFGDTTPDELVAKLEGYLREDGVKP